MCSPTFVLCCLARYSASARHATRRGSTTRIGPPVCSASHKGKRVDFPDPVGAVTTSSSCWARASVKASRTRSIGRLWCSLSFIRCCFLLLWKKPRCFCPAMAGVSWLCRVVLAGLLEVASFLFLSQVVLFVRRSWSAFCFFVWPWVKVFVRSPLSCVSGSRGCVNRFFFACVSFGCFAWRRDDGTREGICLCQQDPKGSGDWVWRAWCVSGSSSRGAPGGSRDGALSTKSSLVAGGWCRWVFAFGAWQSPRCFASGRVSRRGRSELYKRRPCGDGGSCLGTSRGCLVVRGNFLGP